MTRYRLTAAAARRHPSVDLHQIYTAAGPPDELGVMLNVFPDSKEPKDGPWVLRNPQFFFHQDVELVEENGQG